MQKSSTNKIIDDICLIGEKIGLRSVKEHSFNIESTYSPRYDVVWFLNIKSMNTRKIMQKYLDFDNPWLSYFDELPLAVFEVEGSTTTSKNQVGNLINTYTSPAYFKFIITDNAGAGNENDTYRRGIKIIRSFSKLIGNRNIFLLDNFHLKKIYKIIMVNPVVYTVDSKMDKQRKKGSGGETISNEHRLKIENDFSECNLVQFMDWEPENYNWYYDQFATITANDENDFILGKKVIYKPDNEIRKVNKRSDYYYVPKLDLCYGFYLVNGFIDFIKNVALCVSPETYNYPLLDYVIKQNKNKLFFPLVTFEIESGYSKHCNGGIINMSFHSFCGIVIGNLEINSHLKSLHKTFGIQNVFFKNWKLL